MISLVITHFRPLVITFFTIECKQLFIVFFCNRILLRIKNAYTALTVGTMVTVSENVELRNMGPSDARVAIA